VGIEAFSEACPAAWQPGCNEGELRIGSRFVLLASLGSYIYQLHCSSVFFGTTDCMGSFVCFVFVHTCACSMLLLLRCSFLYRVYTTGVVMPLFLVSMKLADRAGVNMSCE
jgi:hypothetical protein